MGSSIIKLGGGIRLKKRFTRFFRCRIRKVNPIMRAVRRWGEKLRRRFALRSGYARLDRVHEEEEEVPVPKGHVAVYVGRKEEEEAAERVVVPLIYVNHPLFGRLLREAEEKYGFDYPGGITLPCHLSEFESIQNLIADGRKFKYSHWGYH